MDPIDYKDYVTVPHHSLKEHRYMGKILGLKEDITYEAHHQRDVKQAFKDAVDKYLADCEKEGKTPEVPYDEPLTLKLSWPVHKGLLVQAAEADISVEQYINDTLERHLVEDLNTWDY